MAGAWGGRGGGAVLETHPQRFHYFISLTCGVSIPRGWFGGGARAGGVESLAAISSRFCLRVFSAPCVFYSREWLRRGEVSRVEPPVHASKMIPSFFFPINSRCLLPLFFPVFLPSFDMYIRCHFSFFFFFFSPNFPPSVVTYTRWPLRFSWFFSFPVFPPSLNTYPRCLLPFSSSSCFWFFFLPSFNSYTRCLFLSLSSASCFSCLDEEQTRIIFFFFLLLTTKRVAFFFFFFFVLLLFVFRWWSKLGVFFYFLLFLINTSCLYLPVFVPRVEARDKTWCMLFFTFILFNTDRCCCFPTCSFCFSLWDEGQNSTIFISLISLFISVIYLFFFFVSMFLVWRSRTILCKCSDISVPLRDVYVYMNA